MGNGCAKRVSLYDNGTTASVAGDVRPGSHNAASISGDNSVHSGDSSIFRPRRQVCRSCQAQRLVKEGDVEGLLLVLSKEPSLLVCKLGCACTSLASRLRSALAVSHSLCTYICQEGERKLELLQAVGQLIRSGLSADTMQRLAGLNAPPLHHSNPNSARPIVAMTVHPEAHETTAGSASPPADAGDGSGAAVNRSSHARKAVLAMFLDRPDSRKHTGLILACVLRDPRVVSWLVSQVCRQQVCLQKVSGTSALLHGQVSRGRRMPTAAQHTAQM